MRMRARTLTSQVTGNLPPAKAEQGLSAHPLPILKLPPRLVLCWRLHLTSCMAMLKLWQGAGSNPPPLHLLNSSPAVTSTFNSHLTTPMLSHNSMLSSTLVTTIQVRRCSFMLSMSKGRPSPCYAHTASTSSPQTTGVAQLQLLLTEQTGWLPWVFTTCCHRGAAQQVSTPHLPSSSMCHLWVSLSFTRCCHRGGTIPQVSTPKLPSSSSSSSSSSRLQFWVKLLPMCQAQA